MFYQHGIDSCLDASLGTYGVSRAHLDTLLLQLALAVKSLVTRKNSNAIPLLDLPSVTTDLEMIKILAADIRKRFKHVVVVGSGGSGVSGRTLTQFKLLSASFFSYLDTVDPDLMDDLLAHLDMENTCFIVISKSGTTVETLSQYYVLLDHVQKKMGKPGVRERFVVITMPGNSPLRQSAEEYGLRVLDHAPDIGGRFSILTVVGLLPAAIAGLDISALRRGAQSVVATLAAASLWDCAPAVGAALQYAFIQKSYPITVMLPYSERLSGFSAWYRQGWAESLGKQGKGSTPIRAIGTSDQHSQLQLYLDGPKDKLFHMIMLDRTGSGQRINAPNRPDLEYLRGKTTGDVMAAEQQATFETLLGNHCPVRLFTLNVLGEEQMGALLMHFMLEIILVAGLLGVDPFDQPAVEEGKVLAQKYLLTGKL